jgi:hypothetical protein
MGERRINPTSEAVKQSQLVRVSPQERIRANPGESPTQTRQRYAAEQSAVSERIRQNQSDSRFYQKISKADPFTQAGAEIERAIRKRMK